MIGEERPNALLLVYIHLDIFLDYNKTCMHPYIQGGCF